MTEYNFEELIRGLNINEIIEKFTALLETDYINNVEPVHYIKDLNYSVVFFKHSYFLFKEPDQRVYTYIDTDTFDIDLSFQDDNRFLYVYAIHEEEFEKALKFIRYFFEDKDIFLLLKGDSFSKFIKGQVGFSVNSPVYSTLPPEHMDPPFITDPKLEIRKLTRKNFQFVKENYDSSDSYILERIEDLML